MLFSFLDFSLLLFGYKKWITFFFLFLKANNFECPRFWGNYLLNIFCFQILSCKNNTAKLCTWVCQSRFLWSKWRNGWFLVAISMAFSDIYITRIWNAFYKHLFIVKGICNTLYISIYVCVCILLNIKMFWYVTPNISATYTE